jgi:predicted deacylase
LQDTFTIGNISAKPGEKKSGFIEFWDNSLIASKFPVVIINGSENGPKIAVNAGLHPFEYAGMEAAIRLSKNIDPSDVKGALVIIPIANVAGFLKAIETVHPVDNLNLNRVFPGISTGSMSQILAYGLFNEVVLKVNYLLDLHGGELETCHPYMLVPHKNQETFEAGKRMANVYGPDYLWELPDSLPEVGWSSSGLLITQASMRGIPAIVIEAGQNARIEESHVQFHLNGISNVLKQLQIIKGEPTRHGNPKIFKKMVFLTSTASGMFYPLAKEGIEVSKDEPLAEVRDFFGNPLTTIRANTSGILLHVSQSPPIRNGGVIAMIGELT